MAGVCELRGRHASTLCTADYSMLQEVKVVRSCVIMICSIVVDDAVSFQTLIILQLLLPVRPVIIIIVDFNVVTDVHRLNAHLVPRHLVLPCRERSGWSSG